MFSAFHTMVNTYATLYLLQSIYIYGCILSSVHRWGLPWITVVGGGPADVCDGVARARVVGIKKRSNSLGRRKHRHGQEVGGGNTYLLARETVLHFLPFQIASNPISSMHTKKGARSSRFQPRLRVVELKSVGRDSINVR